MNIKYRKIYTYSVIILFIIIAPLLLIYAAGYRFDINKRTILKTGILKIESKPDKARIILNGKIYKKTSPTIVKNLLSQDYLIKLEKAGYHSWEKKLNVLANKATLTEKVLLLKNTTPQLINENEISYFHISPLQTYLVYLIKLEKAKYKLVIYRLNDNKIIKEIPIIGEINLNFLFSSNEQYLIIAVDNNYQFFSLLNLDTPFLLNKLTNLNFSKIKNSSLGENIYYGLSNGKIYQIDIIQKKIQFLLEDEIKDFIEANNYIYYLTEENNSILINKINLNDNLTKQTITTIPLSNEVIIKNSSKNIITVLDKLHKQLYLIDISNQLSINIRKITPSVIDFNWNNDQSKLLFYNEFEIWTLNLENDQLDLLIRSTEEIKKANWFPLDYWIIFQQANKIKAIELDGRDKRNLVELTNNVTDQLILYKNLAFFIGQQDHTNSLYQLDLN